MKTGLNLALALALVLALTAFVPSAPAWAQEGEVVAEGFNGPQGVLVAADGSIYVVDGGTGGDTPIEMVDPASGQVAEAMMGETSRIVQVLPDGTQNVIATLPSVHVGEDFIGGARLAFLNDILYVTSGEWHEAQGDKTQELMAAIVKVADGAVESVADTWRSERRMNPDGAQRHSHPYGMAAGPDGKLWVTEAGGNSLLKVGPDAGFIETITAFAPMEGVFPNPNRGGEMLTDPVPTGIAFDDAGNAYVSLLSGAPFIPGTAKVVKVAGVQVSDYATGLTMLTDIARGPDGNLYAVQIGVLTDQGPVPNSGAIIQIAEGEGSAPVVEGLSFPTSIGFNEAGDAFVTTNGVGAPGSGQVVKFAGLAGAGMEEEAEAAEGEMAEGEAAEGEMAEGEAAEGEMAAPEQLPATGASLPVSGSLAAVLAAIGAAAVGLLFARRRTS